MGEQRCLCYNLLTTMWQAISFSRGKEGERGTFEEDYQDTYRRPERRRQGGDGFRQRAWNSPVRMVS